MLDDFKKIGSDALEELKGISDGGALEAFRVKYIGKKGSVTGMLGQIRNLDAQDRREGGQLANNTKKQVTAAYEELKKQFGEGAIVMRPGNQLVCSEGESFLFVPIFFFAEFTKRSDLNDKESPMTLVRSFDQASDLAQLARDPDKREEVYEGHEGRPEKDQMKYRYVESLRFAGVIYGDHELTGTPCSLSFERGEFSQGKNFVSAIRLRKTKVETEDGIRAVAVPLWAQVWEIGSVFRDKGAKKWFGV